MLDRMLKLYLAYMAMGTTGLIPHLVGPPGSGKSTVAQQLAELLGVRLHIISVARLNSLEVEGVQMPVAVDGEHVLKMLPATFWTQIREGDIVLYDEFMEGFPEVYNSLLDIFTSRRVGAFRLPRVFMMAASNSAVAPTPAMQDRMLNIPVADPRRRKTEKKRIAELLVRETGMIPEIVDDVEMHHLLDEVVLPTFDVLDQMVEGKGRKANAGPKREGRSLRNLISQVQLRYVQTPELKELVELNNRIAMAQSKYQYVIVLNKAPVGYQEHARRLVGNPRLTEVQAANLAVNLQLIELAEAKLGKEEEDD